MTASRSASVTSLRSFRAAGTPSRPLRSVAGTSTSSTVMPSVTAPWEILRTSGASTKRLPARVRTTIPSNPPSSCRSTRRTSPTGRPNRSTTGVPGSKVRKEAGTIPALLQVPAEVDLGAHDPVLVVECEHLGVPSPAAAGGVALVGDDHLVARLDQADEVEALAPPRPGPAALEVAVAVELGVGRGGEQEVVAQALLEEAPVSGGEGGVGVAGDLLSVGGHGCSLTGHLG